MSDEHQQLLESPAASRWSKAMRDAIATLGKQASAAPSAAPASSDDAAAPIAVAADEVPETPIAPSPQAAAVPAPEPWITKHELATLMHVTTKTIDRRVRDGMPCGGGPVGSVRFKLSECEAWQQQRQGSFEAPDPERARLRVERLRSSTTPLNERGSADVKPDAAPEGPRTRAQAPRAHSSAEQPSERAEAVDGRSGDVRAAPAAAVEPWSDVDTVASHLACGPEHIYELARRTGDGRIPHRRDGQRLLFRLSRVDAWLDRDGAAG